MAYGKICCGESISAQKRSLGLIGNLEILIFGQVSWQLKKNVFPHGSFSIRDGSEIKFCHDKWLGTTTLQEQYPTLYNIVRHKGDTLCKVMETTPPSMMFRRELIGPRLTSCNELLNRLASVHLVHGPDEFRWELTKNGDAVER
jgi:hypothetical protein